VVAQQCLRELSNKGSSIPLWKNGIFVSFNGKNGTKAAKLARDFNNPTTAVTTILKS